MPTRRRFLAFLAALFPTLERSATGERHSSTETDAEEGSCELTTTAIDGPYYVDEAFVRTDISEDREGIPLTLNLKIIDAENCAPIPDAIVDLWHCDALGNYSGFPNADPDEFPDIRNGANATSDLKFCRGRQTTDSNGIVRFQTIFPGWYTPRTVHIHLKAFLDDKEVIGTQLYFPQELNDEILGGESPYAQRGKSPYQNDGDMVINRSGGSTNAWPAVKRSDDGAIHATHTIVVNKSPAG